MRRIVRSVTTLSTVLLASSAASFATACSSTSDVTAPAAQIPGSYTLRTVNGASLPFALTPNQSGSYVLVADTFVFKSDGTFTEQLDEDFTATGATTATRVAGNYSGTWKLSGTSVSLVFPADQSALTGAFTNGNTITFSGGGVLAVYQK